jgi:hypothetical protein
MPAKGFRSLTIREEAYLLAQRLARERGMSLADFLVQLIEKYSRGELEASRALAQELMQLRGHLQEVARDIKKMAQMEAIRKPLTPNPLDWDEGDKKEFCFLMGQLSRFYRDNIGDHELILELEFKVDDIASLFNELGFSSKVVDVVWYRGDRTVEGRGVIVKGFNSWERGVPAGYITGLISEYRDAYVRGLLFRCDKTDGGFCFPVFPENLYLPPAELYDSYGLAFLYEGDVVEVPESFSLSNVIEAQGIVKITRLIYFVEDEEVDRLYSAFGIGIKGR